MKRACFLDRDGVLVRAFPEGDTTRGPQTVEEIEILPGTLEACRSLRAAGYLLAMVTNQPSVARGQTTREDADTICEDIMYALPLDAYYLCPHDNNDACACRKPHPGLIYQAAVEHELDLSQCWMIGDRETDREAAIRAGIPQTRAIKIQTNQGITRAVEFIISQEHFTGARSQWMLANSR